MSFRAAYISMRRLFIIRKDLHLHPGKLAAMVGHCAECYWMNLLTNGEVRDNEIDTPNADNSIPAKKVSVEIPKEVWEGYIKDIFTKTICEAKNLNHLMKVVDVAKELGFVEGIDYGFIDDVYKTDLTPEFTDENGVGRCRVGIWFKPLPDDVSHTLSRKYQLYKD